MHPMCGVAPAEEFARYGYDVITGWLLSGKVWHEVFKKTGRHPPRPSSPFDRDTVHDLAQDTVVNALDAFLEKILKKNRWDPERGASLKTYFVGQCCFQFENVLRGHYRRQGRSKEHVLADPSDWQVLLGTVPDPDRELLDVEHLNGLLDAVASDTAREAFALQHLGFSESEIADRLGLADAKAIENMLAYQRRKAKDQRRKEQAG
jgi:DNA-directed RNA polymerase specialized sigma24 family protein